MQSYGQERGGSGLESTQRIHKSAESSGSAMEFIVSFYQAVRQVRHATLDISPGPKKRLVTYLSQLLSRAFSCLQYVRKTRLT